MNIVCIRVGESRSVSYLAYHDDFLIASLKVKWCAEMGFPKKTQVTFRNRKGNAIDDNLTIGDLTPVVPWAAVVYLTADVQKDNDKLEFRNKSQKVWQVEPTVGSDSFGRWIVRPDFTIGKNTKYSIICGLFHGDSVEFHWKIVELREGQRMENVRQQIAEACGQPLTDFSFSYQSGCYYRSEDGSIRHGTGFALVENNCINEVMCDDVDGTVVPTDSFILQTLTVFHDDSRLSIPLKGAPRIFIFTKTKYLCSSDEEERGFRILDCDKVPLHDQSIVAFNDGVTLRDKDDDEGKNLKLFASLNAGSQLADTQTGQLFLSNEELHDSDDLDIPKEQREWGQFVYLFYENRKLPRWKIPEDYFLQVITRPHETLEFRDGALIRKETTAPFELGTSAVDMWCDRFEKEPDASKVFLHVSNYMRSGE